MGLTSISIHRGSMKLEIIWRQELFTIKLLIQFNTQRQDYASVDWVIMDSCNGPLARYVKLRVAHGPGTFSSKPRISDPDMHHGTCVTHVPWCMPGSLTSSLLWSRWREKRSRRMHNPQFNVSGKRPMACGLLSTKPSPELMQNNG